MKSRKVPFAVVAFCFTVLSCQTQKPAIQAVPEPQPIAETQPRSSAPSSISSKTAGFSPYSRDRDLLTLDLRIGDIEAMTSWSVMLEGAQGIQKTYFGGAADFRSELTWDGRADSGVDAPEGAYTASLFVQYGAAFFPATAKSPTFILDRVPPEVSLSVVPEALRFASDGSPELARIGIAARSQIAAIQSWTLVIAARNGIEVRRFEGLWPQDYVLWDGFLNDGSRVDRSGEYTASVMVRDEFGNAGTTWIDLPVAPIPPPAPQSIAKPDTVEQSKAGASSLKESPVAVRPIETKSAEKPSDPPAPRETPSAAPPAAIPLATPLPDRPKASSAPIAAPLSPPALSLRVDPAVISPVIGEAAAGGAGTVGISLSASFPPDSIADWTIRILDPGANEFRAFRGTDAPPTILWDGTGTGGETVESASDYTVTATVRDRTGNVVRANAVIKSGIITVREGDRYRIRIPSIVFEPNTALFSDPATRQGAANRDTLAELAGILKKFPDYAITVVGHAVMVNWNDPELGRREQAAVLIPLSLSRAEAIRKSLIELGIDSSKITAVGAGALDPIVPDSDMANRWKNRRVDFYLQKTAVR